MKSLIVVSKLMTAVVLGSLLSLGACTKKRSEKLAPGQGDNLESVSTYKNKVFKLITLKPVDKAQGSLNVSKSKNVNYKSPKYGLDNFSVVNYKTEAKLLGSTKIVARPDTTDTYEIHYIVTNDYIKVMKVAKEADIPLQERTYAEDLADGRKAIPLIGYKIQGKYILEKIQTDIGQKTNLLREKPVNSINEATHFKVDLSSPEIFKAVQKPDLLPASYFDGEWFFAETVVQAPESEKEQEGFLVESGIDSSTRIKFIKNKDFIEAVSLNLDERLKKQNDINFSRVFLIPIEWKQYQAEPLGKNSGMREEENNELSFDKKNFLLVDFEKIISNASEGSTSKLVNVEIEDDYLSFTLEKNVSSIRFKISLRRVSPSNYTKKVHFDDDWEKFGFFTTTKSSIQNFEVHRKEDIEKNVFISRFNPKSEKIEFRFSKTTPTWLRPSVRRSIVSWDDAYCRAFNGVDSQACDQINSCKISKIDTDKNNESCNEQAKKAHYLQITLNEKDGDVDLGDLRYNIINLIESETEGNLFGYGPSLTDPYTGEIISATTNVHVTPIRSALIEEIRNYVLMKLKMLPEVKLGGTFDLAKKENVKVDSKTSSLYTDAGSFGYLENLKLPIQILKFISPETASKIRTQGQYINLDFRKGNSPYGRELDLSVTSHNIHQEIEKRCPEITLYITELQNSKVTHNEKEIEKLNECSKKLVVDKMTGTMIHELGHNFGLRHNFKASNDVANFWPTNKNNNHLVRSSSVMEYPAFNEDRLIKPGLYDIAALQYGYADKVTDTDGAVHRLNTGYTIERNLGGKSRKAFKFCTDDHVAWGLDPMCERHDAGLTPSDVVQNIINEFRTSYATLNYRHDKISAPKAMNLGSYRLRRFYMPLKKFHDQWRIHLSEYIGREKMYLEGMDEETYDSTITAMMQDSKVSDEIKNYKVASDKAFNFLFSVSTMSNQYCLVQDTMGMVDLVEFEKVRQESYIKGKNFVYSCQHEDAKEWFVQNSMQVLTQLGYPITDVKYDLRPEKATEAHDISGNGADRIFALLTLGLRKPLSLKSAQMGFAPNFLDVPTHRKDMILQSLNRLANGVSIENLEGVLRQTLNAESIDKLKKIKPFFKKFDYEKEITQYSLSTLLEGILIPGKQSENMKRLKEFEINKTSSSTDIKSAQNDPDIIIIPLTSSALLINKKTKNMAAVAGMYQTANEMKDFKAVSKDVIEIFKTLVQSINLPQSKVDAKNISTVEYIKNFKTFREGLDKLSKEKQEEMTGLLNFYPEIVSALTALISYANIEEKAAINSIEDLKNLIKAGVQKQVPDASDAQAMEQAEATVNQLKAAGKIPANFSEFVASNKKSLEKMNNQLSKNPTDLLEEALLTQDTFAEYLKQKELEIAVAEKEAKFNHKDYEAQVDLILGFLTSLAGMM